MPAPATSRLLRRMNAQRVLDEVRGGGLLRVSELVALTGLSRPTVDAVADDLVRLGWLDESAAETPRRGRPARSLSFRADAGYVAAVDIGEVKVRTAVADLNGEIVAERVREFDGERSAADHPPHRTRDARGRRSHARTAPRRVRRLHRPDGPADRPRPVQQHLRGRLRPRGCAGGDVRPPPGGRERLQPGGDRRALGAPGSTTSSRCSRASGSARGSWSAAR